MNKRLIEWMWISAFVLVCFAIYEQSLKKRNDEYRLLHTQLLELQQTKEDALQLHEELLLKYNSQSDPAWVELTLMRELGVIPENQTKIFFPNPP